jgi:hypothetical protein
MTGMPYIPHTRGGRSGIPFHLAEGRHVVIGTACSLVEAGYCGPALHVQLRGCQLWMQDTTAANMLDSPAFETIQHHRAD